MELDADVGNWVLEHLLRQPMEEQTLKLLLRATPPNGNPNVEKSLLLKKLEFSISGSSVSEETLELLGQLEELEFRRGNETPSETMKQAFCAAAVECTLKHLKGEDVKGEKRFELYEAVEGIWRGKVERMKKFGGLCSKPLWEWKDEMEAAVFNDEAANRVLKKGEGVDGVEAVRVYISEERRKMGPSFLEMVVETAKTDQTLQKILGIGGGGSVDQVAGKEASSSPEKVAESAKSDQTLQENLGIGGGGSVDQVAAKEASPSPVNEVAGASNVNRGGVDQVAGKEASPSPVNEVAGASNVNRETSKGRTKLREKHLAPRRPRVKIVGPDETTNGPSGKVPGSVEVRKAREALESSLLDLQAVVKDPLPDALKIAQAISNEARNNNPRPPTSSTQAPGGNTSNAHVSESDDSTDDGAMPQLPTPTRINTSPLNQYEFETVKKPRRKPWKWSLQEEETLREAVDKYGRHWKKILDLNQDTFQYRTEGDLKDKWRNMTK